MDVIQNIKLSINYVDLQLIDFKFECKNDELSEKLKSLFQQLKDSDNKSSQRSAIYDEVSSS